VSSCADTPARPPAMSVAEAARLLLRIKARRVIFGIRISVCSSGFKHGMKQPGKQDGRVQVTPKWSAPAGSVPGRGCRVYSAKGPVSRILSCAVIPLGAALPRTLISDLPGGFGDCIEQPERAPRHVKSRLNASGRCAAPPGSWQTLPSLFGLAPCGVYPAPGVTAGAVRSYRTISPLPRQDWPSRRT